jgi:hypothetical protein
MRRLRILMTAALMVATVCVWAGAAEARGSKFCETARDAFEGGDVTIDPNDLDVTEEQIEEAIDNYEEFLDEAPKRLRKPYRTLLRYYRQIEAGDFDFSDPEDVEELAEQSQKVARATTKIYDYLVDECGIDVPNVTVPDVSLPDISIPDLEGN